MRIPIYFFSPKRPIINKSTIIQSTDGYLRRQASMS